MSNSLKKFKEKASEDYKKYRYDVWENFGFVEEYCNNKYNSGGNNLDKLSKEFDFIKGNEIEVIEIIKLDYVKSNSLNFIEKLNVKQATDSLRVFLLGQNLNSTYSKNHSRALLEILKQIRDNLTHRTGKRETRIKQFLRNFLLIKNSAIILDRIVKKIEEVDI